MALKLFLSLILFGVIEAVHEQLDPNFMIMYEAKDNGIEIEMFVKTTGWIGIGFNNDTTLVSDVGTKHGGAMHGADFFIGNVVSGAASGKDRFLPVDDHDMFPREDKNQNWEVKSGSEKDGETVIKVFRLLDTKDTDEDVKITEEEMVILWAFNKDTDVISKETMHTNKGAKKIKLNLGSGASTLTTSGFIMTLTIAIAFYLSKLF